MQKTQAFASLGQHRLMLPAWVKAALSANDRLKVYLTVLQSAATHAAHPHRDVPDLSKEISAAGLNPGLLHELAAVSRRVDDDLFVPDLPRLVKGIADDLEAMARPVLETTPTGGELHRRVQHRLDWLGGLAADRLSDQQVTELTHGHRGEGDSLHLLVMDLHKKIDKLSGFLASEVIAGANVWELLPQDRPRVRVWLRRWLARALPSYSIVQGDNRHSVNP
jgi:hypothetical protein